ncbi:ogr/Delta-like zinc finger family protein [Candidatus Pantoea multigeneris]|uniref:ogr/Delta-like zinc finger family protein n=1 Tax=Candidatus Pantoea multigeneris TaxID=2608357 RepID=UPI0034E2B0FF
MTHAHINGHLSENTKERYHQCTHINCSCTFVMMELVGRFIVTPGMVTQAPPHLTFGGQRTLWL